MIPSRRLCLLFGLLVSLTVSAAGAAGIGWRSLTIPAAAGLPPIAVALWYPAAGAVSMRTTAMGPFSVNAAIAAPAAEQFAGLVAISHGTGGSELGHGRIAESLAARGYLVAALRHPGDNWQDESLRTHRASRYFDERPRHVSRVLDVLLADPAWGPRVVRDVRGHRIAALGHSAGGYTVLALAGAIADPSRIAAHCAEKAKEDPIFCALPRGDLASAATSSNTPPKGTGAGGLPAAGAPLADSRVRAVVALSPLAVMLDPGSLRKLDAPVALWVAEGDRFLVPRFHGGWAAQQLRRVQSRSVPLAGHFAFMDKPAWAIPSPDGDIAADRAGFDRARFLKRLGAEIGAFLDQHW